MTTPPPAADPTTDSVAHEYRRDREVIDAATPEPWYLADGEAEGFPGSYDVEDAKRNGVFGHGSPEQVRANYVFVAAARTRWPATLADRDHLQAVVGRLLGAIEAMHGALPAYRGSDYTGDYADAADRIAAAADSMMVIARQERERFGQPPGAAAYAERDAAMSDVVRLEGLVASLPRSHDGATIVPGMTLYRACYDGVHTVTVKMVGIDRVDYSDPDEPGIPFGGPVDYRDAAGELLATSFADRAGAEAWYAENRGRLNRGTVPDADAEL